MSDAPRVFFYVQHLLGIGHLARASRIASALSAAKFAVTLVTGGPPVQGFPPAGLAQVPLPPVTALDQAFSGLVDLDGNPVDEAYRERRRAALIAALETCRPDIVIIEAFPFGRRQMRFELMPLIAAVEAMEPKPFLLASVRDIVQERVKPGRHEETAALVAQHFDLVMVHGDPAFAPLELSFPLAGEIEPKIAYTGLVAGPAVPPSAERFDVVVSAGGGAAGASLAAAVPDAARRSGSAQRWLLAAGPNLPDADYSALERAAPANLTVCRFRRDFPNLLAACGVSVSQAGYNTVCDVLVAGCRSVLVPFTAGGETEQAARAWRLEQLGLARVLPEQGLTPALLAEAVDDALASGRPQPHAIDLDGAARTAELLNGLLEARGGPA